MSRVPPERVYPRGGRSAFEGLQIARDRDQDPEGLDERLSGQPIDAQIDALRDEGVVVLVPEHKQFVHRPGDTVFGSPEALVLFHEGWEAARSG